MKKNCETYLEQILSPELPLTPAAAEHLRHCPTCAGMRRDVMTLLPPSPPDALRGELMAEAGREAGRRKFRRTLFRSIPVAAAALVMLTLGITFFAPSAKEATPTAPRQEKAIDWATLEEESYGLDRDLLSCQYALANL